MNTGLEQDPKGREFQHIFCKLREPPVSGPDRWPASTAVVAANGAFSARLDHSCARSRFPNSVTLTSRRPDVYRGLTLFSFQV
ncbi:hypothetical protein T07_4809 [Trichinella nelsoni]|uniref:Uncharacterized protein n=1 Tax=Trichinella nelsoni TaxID=6336 RepID=A0A0V0RNC1_9BILA|nr:hypothetical protein T07_4809 [Trichinella nelsoni]